MATPKRIRTSSGDQVPLADFNLSIEEKKFCPKHALEDLLTCKKILDSETLQWGVSFGTMLGAVRGSDFIEHDTDVDVATFARHKDIVIDLLPKFVNEGFELIRFEPDIISVTRGNAYLDFYFFKKSLLGYRSGNLFIANRFMKFDSKVTLRGHEFPSHRDASQLLSKLYGQDWKIPKKNSPAITRRIFWKAALIKLFPSVTRKIGELRRKSWLGKNAK